MDNEVFTLVFGQYRQDIDKKLLVGNLNPLWEYGNGVRALKGLPPLRMNSWLRKRSTLEFIDSLKDHYGDQFNFVDTARGMGGRTIAHFALMLKAAEYLDSEFSVRIFLNFYETVVLPGVESP